MRREHIEILLKAVKVSIAVTRVKFEGYQINPSLSSTTEGELAEEMKNHYKMRNWLMIQLAQAEK